MTFRTLIVENKRMRVIIQITKLASLSEYARFFHIARFAGALKPKGTYLIDYNEVTSFLYQGKSYCKLGGRSEGERSTSLLSAKAKACQNTTGSFPHRMRVTTRGACS